MLKTPQAIGPGIPRQAVIVWFAMTILLAIMDAFGVSTAFGLAGALMFWAGLVGINMGAWHVWRRSSRGSDRIDRRFLLGAMVLNGLLALEVPLLYRAMGRTEVAVSWRPFVYGLLATAFITFVLRAKSSRTEDHVGHEDPDSFTVASPAQTQKAAILAKAAIHDAADLLSVRAEDHYCRLMLRNGQTLLIHYRFKDAVSDLEHLPGAQVHRGAWVADHAVAGAERIGRRWALQLTDHSSVPVSETSVALCRARGWLRPVVGSA